jgi:hypothetical protein
MWFLVSKVCIGVGFLIFSLLGLYTHIPSLKIVEYFPWNEILAQHWYILDFKIDITCY